MSVSGEEVLALVCARVAHVLGLSRSAVSAEARFADELGADSLDLLEIVESVERELRNRGVTVDLPDSELLTITTVGEVAERLAAHSRGPGGGHGVAP